METNTTNAQGISHPETNSPCPAPFNITLDASAPNVEKTDFTAAQLANYQDKLNYGQTDKWYLHTFIWKAPSKCCQVTKAILTVKMKANSGGQSVSSADAGNDSISVVKLGTAVPPYSEHVYTAWPFNAGKTSTKIWDLTGVALGNINILRRLSFAVQDDTSVLSATLQLSGCCLKLENI